MALSTARFAGRTALVTGSGRNIGRAVALALAAGGASVVVNGHRDRAAVEAVVAEIGRTGGRAMGVMADVSSHDEVADMVGRAVVQFGSLDIVVSNVGIRRMRPFLDIGLDEWNEVIGTNLSPAFYLARNAIPHMRKRKWGRIVLVSGFDAFWGQVTQRAHSIAAKSGLHGLTKALAREFGPDGITANTVAPGAIDTERDWSQYRHQPRDQIEKEIPLGRYGNVNEVAETCAFLACDAGGFVSGQVVHVNGGHYMY